MKPNQLITIELIYECLNTDGEIVLLSSKFEEQYTFSTLDLLGKEYQKTIIEELDERLLNDYDEDEDLIGVMDTYVILHFEKNTDNDEQEDWSVVNGFIPEFRELAKFNATEC